MPSIGPMELIVVLILALLVFGPKRLPEMGRSLGKSMREFKESISAKPQDDEPPNESQRQLASRRDFT